MWMVAPPRTRVHASRFPRSLWKRRSEKKAASVSKKSRARRVRFVWLPRKVNDSWISTDRNKNRRAEIEEEQYLPHEKANSCSRVSLILFFSVLFSFANPSTFRGYPYVGVSMVFGIGLYNFTIVPAMMLLKKRNERETKKKSRSSSGGDGDDDDVGKGKVVLLWSSESVSSQYSMSNLTRDFCFYVFAMLALALFVARDAMFIIDDDEVNSANATAAAAEDDDITRFVLAKNRTSTHSDGDVAYGCVKFTPPISSFAGFGSSSARITFDGRKVEKKSERSVNRRRRKRTKRKRRR